MSRIGGAMPELDEFKSFFTKYGITFEAGDNTHLYYKDARKDSIKYLSVNSTHFHFKVNGDFLGTECDETGNFTARG